MGDRKSLLSRLFVYLLTLQSGLVLADFEAPTSVAPQNRQEFCRMHRTYAGARMQFFNPQNKIAFDNPAGFVDAGLCWWHSRLQRSAAYLAIYQPQKAKPTVGQATQIIDEIFRTRAVVEIPGYSNFQTFSHDYASLLNLYLSTKQVEDTLYFTFWRGIRPSNVSTQFIHRQAERIYQRVAVEDKTQFLALKGYEHWYVTHAWLVVGAVRSGSNIDFYLVDSNDNPMSVPKKFTYRPGDKSFNGKIPYLQFDSDYWGIDSAINQYCR